MSAAQGTRPARRTRERILEATLGLYNELGEPNVSTTLIASEVGISAGNLHYHFRKKDQLTGALLDRFVEELDQLLPPEQWRAGDVEDAWFLLHMIFEAIWRYRFLFRDLSGIMTRDRRAGHRLTAVFGRSVEASRGIALGLSDSGALVATPAELEALAENVTVMTLYWLSYDTVRYPRLSASASIARGIYQVLMLFAPFLLPQGRAHLEALAGEYLRKEQAP
jgi:AcrR family transcriptional regulator